MYTEGRSISRCKRQVARRYVRRVVDTAPLKERHEWGQLLEVESYRAWRQIARLPVDEEGVDRRVEA